MEGFSPLLNYQVVKPHNFCLLYVLHRSLHTTDQQLSNLSDSVATYSSSFRVARKQVVVHMFSTFLTHFTNIFATFGPHFVCPCPTPEVWQTFQPDELMAKHNCPGYHYKSTYIFAGPVHTRAHLHKYTFCRLYTSYSYRVYNVFLTWWTGDQSCFFIKPQAWYVTPVVGKLWGLNPRLKRTARARWRHGGRGRIGRCSSMKTEKSTTNETHQHGYLAYTTSRTPDFCDAVCFA